MCPYRYEYHWCDGVNYKKPTALPAPQYITLLMEWVESQINDESIFPVKVGRYFIPLLVTSLAVLQNNTPTAGLGIT